MVRQLTIFPETELAWDISQEAMKILMYLQENLLDGSLEPNFQKGGPWQDLSFWRGVAGKEGVTFFQGGGAIFT